MTNKLRFKLEYLWYYTRKYALFFLIGIALGSGIFLFKDKALDLINLPSRHPQIIGLTGLYTQNSLPEDLKKLLSYGLTINDQNDRPTLSPLIDSYVVSEDGHQYIFTLKPGLQWHDGSTFNTYDIDYQFSGITFRPLSDRKIEVSSKDTFAPLMSLLSRHLFRDPLIGLGPYKAVKIDYQDGYIKYLSLAPKDPHQRALVYKFYPSDDDLINAFKLGEVDQIETSIFPEDLSRWNNSKLTQKIETTHRYSALFFNTDKLNSKQIRQSLAYATPKTADQNDRALSPISASSWAYNPSVKEYAYSPQRATELYNKADLGAITLLVNDRSLLTTAETIKEAWVKNLGLKVTIAIENRIDPQNYDVVLAYGGIPHDPDQYPYWHSTQTKTNLTHLNNPRIDNLLEEGRQTLNYPDRRRIYQDFQKYLLEECPAVFLSYPTTYVVTRVK